MNFGFYKEVEVANLPPDVTGAEVLKVLIINLSTGESEIVEAPQDINTDAEITVDRTYPKGTFLLVEMFFQHPQTGEASDTIHSTYVKCDADLPEPERLLDLP